MEELELSEKKIARKAAKAIHDFGMITAGDRVLVALSGGRASWTLLKALERLRRNSPVKFTVSAVTVNHGLEGFDPSPLARHLEKSGTGYFIEDAPTGENRLIEALSALAKREGFTKIALGHKADDLIETLLAAQFFTGEIRSIPPVQLVNDGESVVIRPLCRVFGEEIERYAELAGFPATACGCPAQRSETGESNRAKMKKMLDELEKSHAGIKANLLSCLGRVRTRYLMQK